MSLDVADKILKLHALKQQSKAVKRKRPKPKKRRYTQLQPNEFSLGPDRYLAVAEYVPATNGLHVYAADGAADPIKRYLLEEADHECYRVAMEEAKRIYAFCPTGEGGGIDNSCSPTGEPGSGSNAEEWDNPNRDQLDRTQRIGKEMTDGAASDYIYRQMRGGFITKGGGFKPFTPEQKLANLRKLKSTLDDIRVKDTAAFDNFQHWSVADAMGVKTFNEVPEFITVYRGAPKNDLLPKMINVTLRREVAETFGDVTAYKVNKRDVIPMNWVSSFKKEEELLIFDTKKLLSVKDLQLSAVWRDYYDKHYHLPGQHDQCDHSVTGDCVDPEWQGNKIKASMSDEDFTRDLGESWYASPTISKNSITMYHVTLSDYAKEIRKEGFQPGKVVGPFQGFAPRERGTYGWSIKERAIFEIQRAVDQGFGDIKSEDYSIIEIEVPRSGFKRLRGDEDITQTSKWLESYKEGSVVVKGAVPNDWVKRIILHKGVKKAGISAVWRDYYDKHYHLPDQHDQCDHSVTGSCKETIEGGKEVHLQGADDKYVKGLSDWAAANQGKSGQLDVAYFYGSPLRGATKEDFSLAQHVEQASDRQSMLQAMQSMKDWRFSARSAFEESAATLLGDNGSSRLKGEPMNMSDNLVAAYKARQEYVQAWAKKQFGSTITLYRGVGTKQSNAMVKAQGTEGMIRLRNGGDTDLKVYGLSSWTTSQHDASTFAGPKGLVFKVEVPYTKIWNATDIAPRDPIRFSEDRGEFVLLTKEPSMKVKFVSFGRKATRLGPLAGLGV